MSIKSFLNELSKITGIFPDLNSFEVFKQKRNLKFKVRFYKSSISNSFKVKNTKD